ncbi:MAG TPA: choice-of-anchor P family protein, partial [Sporichthya sp.]|nr:choice-of-anchor P family protein [Sporichthya sp.]
LRAPRRIAALLAAPALLATGVAIAAPSADAATSDPTYKGSALALSVKVGLAGSSILDEVLPQLVTYPPGAKATLLELPEELAQVVALRVLNVSSQVSDGKLASNAHTASLGVLGDVITARVLNADCTANQGDTEGDSQVLGLTVAGSKIPVDPGPNFKIEIPDALAALVRGSIIIDEQTETKDGGIQIRALHVNLVVAPAAVSDALNSVIRTVRETAEQLKGVIEEVTGKPLGELVGSPENSVAKADKQKHAHSAKKAAQSADEAKVRASAPAAKAPAAAPAAPAEAAAPADAAAPAQAAAPAAETEKSDGADIRSEAAPQQPAEAAAPTEADAPDAPDSAQSADETAAAARAERSEKGVQAQQEAAPAAPAAPGSTDPAVATEQAQPAAPAPAPAKPKADGSDVPVLDKVQSAIPAADSIAGALGVDIIVSQVTCDGEPGVAGVDELPGTGGNGHVARNIAVTGLGLLAAGGAAVVLTRRRRSHVGPAI